MKVILLKDMAKLGKRGEVKDVAESYAINVLIRKGDALQATPAELSKWKQKKESKEYKKELETNLFLQIGDKLKQKPLLINNKKADAKGQLFAQIRQEDIAASIFDTTNISIDHKQVVIPTPIKSIGSHVVYLKQGDKNVTINVNIA